MDKKEINKNKMIKEKSYKSANVINNNIPLGDLKRSPDDYFSKTLVFIDAGFLSKLSKYFGGGKYPLLQLKGKVYNNLELLYSNLELT